MYFPLKSKGNITVIRLVLLEMAIFIIIIIIYNMIYDKLYIIYKNVWITKMKMYVLIVDGCLNLKPFVL